MVNKPKFQKFKKEYAHKLYRIADNDLYAAEYLVGAAKCRPELIIYQVQQSIEKSIKAVLVFEEKQVPLTHDIELLLSELQSSDQKILPEGAAEFSRFATIKRYTEGDEAYDQKDIQSALQVGKVFLNWARLKLVL